MNTSRSGPASSGANPQLSGKPAATRIYPAAQLGGSMTSRRASPIAAGRDRLPRIPLAPLRFLLLALLLCATLFGSGAVAAAPARQDDPLDLTAHAAIVVEYPSGKILYARNSTKQLPMASTTKIMTALLALQRLKLTDHVIVQPEAIVGEASMGLVEGEDVSIDDLLYGLLLPSGNDAAMSLAIAVGDKLAEPADKGPVGKFVALMNAQAQAMGLSDTHFANPHGLDADGHYTSAADLASIAWYAMHDPEFNKITSTQYMDVENHSLSNLNEMLSRYDGADGVKTGFTDNAGLCLVSSATRDGRRLISVVLHADRWYVDSTKLLDYGFEQDPNAAADTLNIAKRADMLWLLASGLPTALPTPRPTEMSLTPVASGAIQSIDTGSNPQIAPTTDNNPAAPASAPASTIVSPQTSDGLGWIVPLLALVLGGGLLFVYWRRAGSQQPAESDATWDEKKQRLSSLGAHGSNSLTPTASSNKALPSRRVSLMDADGPAQHAERAIAMAYRGQEGTSLSEFMMTVERNPEFEFGTVDGFYDMPAAGYLSLARAYAEHKRPHYANALLQLGAETYPEDKAIRRMLVELQPAEAVASL